MKNKIALHGDDSEAFFAEINFYYHITIRRVICRLKDLIKQTITLT